MRSQLVILLICSLFLGLVHGIENDIPQGSTCNNGDNCATGNLCFLNLCRPSGEFPEQLNGFGNECAEQNCCNPGLVCNSITNRCVPSEVNLGIIQCQDDGAPVSPDTPAPYYPDIAPVAGLNLGRDWDREGQMNVTGDCSNRDVCVGGYTCAVNRCIPIPTEVDSIVLPGTGNKCSELDCCRVGLMCSQAEVDGSNRCVVIDEFTPRINCTIVTSEDSSSGGSIFDSSSSGGDIIPPIFGSTADNGNIDDGNAAATFGASYAFIVLAAISGLVMTLAA